MLILAAFDSRLIVVITVFLAAVSLFWFAIDLFGKNEKSSAENRLDMLSDSLRQGSGNKESKKEILAKAFEEAAPSVAKHLQPKTEAEVGKLKSRLAEAGFRT